MKVTKAEQGSCLQSSYHI